MKKLLTTAALAVVAVFGASAAELQDYFNQKIRPVATMAIDAPKSEIEAEGLKASSVAMLSTEAMEKLSKETSFAAPVEQILETTEDGNQVKVWQCPEGDLFEVLLFVKGADQNVAVFACGPKEAVTELMKP